MVVLIHGGGFPSCAHLASSLQTKARQLIRAGDAPFIVNYRCDKTVPASDPPIADRVADLVATTRFAIDQAQRFDGGPSNVTLIGGSAGGTLAANAALKLGPTMVRNVISPSGFFDFPMALPYRQSQPGKLAKHHVKNEAIALGCQRVSRSSNCSTGVEQAWSPRLQMTSSNCPPNWPLSNEMDEANGKPIAQPDSMAAAIHAAGCSVTEDILPGYKHALRYWKDMLPVVTSFIGLTAIHAPLTLQVPSK